MSKYEESHLNKFLTEKEVVGFIFEMEGQELLTSFGISFQGNPTEPVKWKCNVGHGVDIKTQLFLIEFKFCSFKVYPSHVYRHVLPRFDDGDSRAKVVVTNNKVYWYSVKYILNAKGIMLWDLKDLKNYYSIPSFISVYNFIKHNVGATSLVKDNSVILTTQTYKLRSVGEKIPTKSMELSTLEKCLHDGSIEIEAPNKGVPIPSSPLQAKTWKLSDVGGITHSEISEIFGISITTQKGESHEL